MRLPKENTNKKRTLRTGPGNNRERVYRNRTTWEKGALGHQEKADYCEAEDGEREEKDTDGSDCRQVPAVWGRTPGFGIR